MGGTDENVLTPHLVRKDNTRNITNGMSYRHRHDDIKEVSDSLQRMTSTNVQLANGKCLLFPFWGPITLSLKGGNPIPTFWPSLESTDSTCHTNANPNSEFNFNCNLSRHFAKSDQPYAQASALFLKHTPVTFQPQAAPCRV